MAFATDARMLSVYSFRLIWVKFSYEHKLVVVSSLPVDLLYCVWSFYINLSKTGGLMCKLK